MTPEAPPPLATVIGDVVGSRSFSDRSALHDRLFTALESTNELVPAIQPLSLTLGDEFQGVYRDLGTALHAALVIRLRLFGVVSVRFGVGWGALEVFDPANLPFAQDGPAWWAARTAIDFLKETKRKSEVPRGWLTACSIAGGAWTDDVTPLEPQNPRPRSRSRRPSALTSYLNAFLMCRDELVARLTPKQATDLLALIEGHRQADIARAEGVSQSAVSQRATNSGIYAVLQAHRVVRGEAEWAL